MARIVKKPDERREEIIMAARELFQTKGYEKTTMQDRIEKLRIAKGTIYHYSLPKRNCKKLLWSTRSMRNSREKASL